MTYFFNCRPSFYPASFSSYTYSTSLSLKYSVSTLLYFPSPPNRVNNRVRDSKRGKVWLPRKSHTFPSLDGKSGILFHQAFPQV